MIWIPRETADYIVPMQYTFYGQTSSVRELVWESDSIDIGLTRYVGIYRPSEYPLARLQAVLTACLYAPLRVSTAIRVIEPPPEILTFRKWVDDYVL